MNRCLRLTSSMITAISLLLLTVGALSVGREAFADPPPWGDPDPPASNCSICLGCPGKVQDDGSCGVGASCSSGEGCLSCICSERHTCTCR